MTDTVRSDEDLRELERFAIHGLTAELAEETAKLLAESEPSIDVQATASWIRNMLWALSQSVAVQLSRQLCAGCLDFADCPRHGEGAITRGRRIAEGDQLDRARTMGRPIVELSPAAKEAFNDPTILLSISHCKQYAAAVAVVE